MSIRSQTEFEKLRVIGRIVRKALDATANAVRPGITTGELDESGRESCRPLRAHRGRHKAGSDTGYGRLGASKSVATPSHCSPPISLFHTRNIR